jgi:hypothetical protein
VNFPFGFCEELWIDENGRWALEGLAKGGMSIIIVNSRRVKVEEVLVVG